MIRRALYARTAGLPCRLIKTAGSPYLERYYLGALLGRVFYLHRFVGSDALEHLHNHPSDGLSLVLAGGYVEEVVTDLDPSAPNGCTLVTRCVRWLNHVPANRFHRVHSADPDTWTLFITGPRKAAPWGFIDALTDDDGQAVGVVFMPVDPSSPDWHKHAQPGQYVGREPLHAGDDELAAADAMTVLMSVGLLGLVIVGALGLLL